MTTFLPYLFSFLLFFIPASSINSQALEVDWILIDENEKPDGFLTYSDLILDQDEHILSTGLFKGSFDADPDNSSINMVSGDKHQNFFIRKMSNSGALMWFKTFDGTAQTIGLKLHVDEDNNFLVLVLHENGWTDLDPGVEEQIVDDDRAIYLVKFDQNGTYNWHKKIQTFTIDAAKDNYHIDIAQNGNILIVADGLIQNPGEIESTLIKLLAPDGSLIWEKRISRIAGISAGPEEKYLISMYAGFEQNNEIVLVGAFTDTIDVNPDAGIFELHAPDLLIGSIFLLRLYSDGTFNNARQIGLAAEASSNFVYECKKSKDDGFTLSGRFKGSMDFDPDPYQEHTIDSDEGDFNGYLLQLDQDFSFKNIAIFRKEALAVFDSYYSYVTNYFENEDGIQYLSLQYEGNIDIDPGSDVTTIHSGNRNRRLIALDPNGNYLWHSDDDYRHYQGQHYFLPIEISSKNELYYASTFGNLSDLDPGEEVQNFDWKNHYALIKLNPTATATQINEQTQNQVISISPNPSAGIFHIQLHAIKNPLIKIFNSSGKDIPFSIIDQSEDHISMQIPNNKGMFYVNFTNDLMQLSQKVVIR